MKTSLAVLALVGASAQHYQPANMIQMMNLVGDTTSAQLTQELLSIEKGLEWIGDLKLGDIESVIKIRSFLKDLTQLMFIVTYADKQFQQAVIDFGRILNEYIEIAQASKNIASLVGTSIKDASEYTESIEELTDPLDQDDRIDTWAVVVKNIETNAQNVQVHVQKIHAQATTSNENIKKAMANLQQMFAITKEGLATEEEKVQNLAIDAQNELAKCEEEKAEKKKSRFVGKTNPLEIGKDLFETVVDSSIDPCVAKENNVKRTLENVKQFEESKVRFETEIGPDFKATANELLSSMAEFSVPEIMNEKVAKITVDGSNEAALTAIYQQVQSETNNVKVLADSTLRIAENRMTAAKAGLLTQLQNMVIFI